MDPGLVEALCRVGPFDPSAIQARPWGLWADWYRTPEATLKVMVVRPGARMSLQRHARRREVWRIVAGEGEDQGTSPPTPLLPGTTYVVPLGVVHRAANTGPKPLVLVELQLGACSEDDIERLADDYQRT